MCVYIYIYVHIYICTRTHTHTHTHIHIQIHTYVDIHICIFMYVCVCWCLLVCGPICGNPWPIFPTSDHSLSISAYLSLCFCRVVSLFSLSLFLSLSSFVSLFLSLSLSFSLSFSHSLSHTRTHTRAYTLNTGGIYIDGRKRRLRHFRARNYNILVMFSSALQCATASCSVLQYGAVCC